MISIRRGFTLIELLVVVAMIAIILGAITTSITSAQQRARIEKARSEVKAVSQAILAYENYAKGHELQPMENRDADSSSLGFLLGSGGTSETGGDIPVLLMASLAAGGAMRDPWGTPYKVTIRQGTVHVVIGAANGAMYTGCHLPNLYRLSEEERR